jgi:hypothetical protein
MSARACCGSGRAVRAPAADRGWPQPQQPTTAKDAGTCPVRRAVRTRCGSGEPRSEKIPQLPTQPFPANLSGRSWNEATHRHGPTEARRRHHRGAGSLSARNAARQRTSRPRPRGGPRLAPAAVTPYRQGRWNLPWPSCYPEMLRLRRAALRKNSATSRATFPRQSFRKEMK